jgi:hypothetical protein
MRARRRLPLSQLTGGIVEDVIVGAVTASCIGLQPSMARDLPRRGTTFEGSES